MRLITTEAGARITIYSEAKEMPIARYSELQKHSIISSGIGSSAEEVDARYAKTAAFITEDKKVEALKELENARFAILSTLQGVNYATYCFACFVKTINDKYYNDLSEDGLDLVLTALKATGITQQEVEDAVEEVKKKIHSEIELMFPSITDETVALIYYGRIKMYLLELAEELQKVDPDLEAIKKQLTWFQTYNRPMNFRSNESDNVMLEVDRNFAAMCSMMENNGSTNPHEYTVIQFYAKLDYLNRMSQPAQA